jgi:hypothetical protein
MREGRRGGSRREGHLENEFAKPAGDDVVNNTQCLPCQEQTDTPISLFEALGFLP